MTEKSNGTIADAAPIRDSVCLHIQDILDILGANNPQADFDLARRAHAYAESAHAGQTLRNGAPYIAHPLAVADTLARLGLDATAVAAGLLQHAVVDTEASIKGIEEAFGEELAGIVDGLTKIDLLRFENEEGRRGGNIRETLLAVSENIRALIVHLADRLQALRALYCQSPHRQQRIARETMDIHIPLAKFLGLHRIELELEGFCFRYTRPEAYGRINDWLEKRRAEDEEYIREVTDILRGVLDGHGIQADLKSRIKRVSRIFHAMTARNPDLDAVHGLITFRIIVNDVKDCYVALGLLHAAWRPVPGGCRDYIAVPKANGYQALHTTVTGPRGKHMDVHIRTEEMDRLAENGPVSRWWSEAGRRVRGKGARCSNRLRAMLEMEEYPERFPPPPPTGYIVVFTPKGAIKELPNNATPVDFAYQIHTELGDRCVGAKVNGRLAPLHAALHSGDTVEIILSASGRPRPDWLRFVKTRKARTRIRRFVRAEERGCGITTPTF